MNNIEASELFLELADLEDLAGELPFKSASYRKVALSLSSLDEPFEIIVKEKKWEKISGAGKAIKKKLEILVETGKIPALEKWREHHLYSFYPWLTIYKVDPRPLGILIRTLDARNIKDLQDKLKGHDLQKLTGRSGKTAKTLLNNINQSTITGRE